MTEGTILLVDDDAHMRQFFGHTVLSLEGYAVETASDGQEGLKRAKSISPDLIITDMAMPEMSGLSMVEALRSAGHRVPVILMTAEGSEPIAVRALRAGVMDYFIKPFDIDDMLAAVKRVIRATRSGGLRADVIDQRYMQTVSTLVNIAKTVTSILDLEVILKRVVEAAVYLTNAEEGILMLIDEETGELYIRASKNLENDDLNMRLKVENSLAGMVVRSGEPLVISGEGDKRIKTAYLVKSLLYVPLKVNDRVIGLLGLHNRYSERAISAHDQGAISGLGEFAAIAIYNAQLYGNSEEKRQRLSRIFQRLPLPLLLIDREGRITSANPEARELFSGDDRLIGKWLIDLEAHDLINLIQQAQRRGSSSAEIELGGKRTFATQATVVPSMGTVLTLHDITHLKEIDQLKNDLITSLSHDLRSPLTAILSYVELMERVGELNDQQQRFLAEVRRSVYSITSLTNELLDLQKLEAGLDRHQARLHVSGIVRRVYEELLAKAETRRQTVKLSVMENEPYVRGNTTRLRQAFTNLVENAIKYTPDGGLIRIEVTGEGEQILTRIADSGIGIPKSSQANIFKKFYRVPEVRNTHQGTGLGLHIVASIIEAHDGRIWVESTPGKGSTFTVMLPVYNGKD